MVAFMLPTPMIIGFCIFHQTPQRPVVCTVSLLVQIYSIGYMKGEVGYARYFAYLSLFTASMLGLVVADTAGKWPLYEDVTADFVYIRLHGDAELYVSGYTDEALERWAQRIRAWADGVEPALGPAGHLLAVDDDAARLRRDEPADQAQDRALSRPAAAKDDGDLRAREPAGERAEHLALAERHPHPVELDVCLVRRSPVHRPA